jgi:hypothetical protein
MPVRISGRSLGVWLASLSTIAILAACQATHQYTTPSKTAPLAAGESKTFQIVAGGHWRNTGIELKAGTAYRITAEGQWRMSPHCNQTNASGEVLQYNLFCQDPLNTRPLAAVNFQTLIGRIGPVGALFPVGKHLEFTPEESGTLYLGPNDLESFLFDNTGLLSVKVARVDTAPPVRVAERAQPKQFDAPASVASPAPSIDTANLDFGRFHALVIGNDTYSDLPRLGTARADADRIAAVLNREYGYSVTLLRDATRDQILDAFDRLRRELGEDDNLLIYYAGHGWLDPDADRGYWLPVDARRDTRSRWLSNGDITDLLRATRARQVIVVADSCYSGTLTRGVKMASGGSGYLKKLMSKRSRTVLTSGALEPVADSGGGGHSVFAMAFLEALARNKGMVDGTQLYADIRERVRLNADQTPQYSNIRKAGHELGGDFVFARK